jgi:hypothetical protein
MEGNSSLVSIYKFKINSSFAGMKIRNLLLSLAGEKLASKTNMSEPEAAAMVSEYM